jgi:16S rRNA G966 N2-methylase RsmD
LETTTLRIIAGTLRTRKIQFAVDPRTRPMKDRTREAVMSLLGGTFKDAAVFDLFGGTGVLAFETLSRGATNECQNPWNSGKNGSIAVGCPGLV